MAGVQVVDPVAGVQVVDQLAGAHGVVDQVAGAQVVDHCWYGLHVRLRILAAPSWLWGRCGRLNSPPASSVMDFIFCRFRWLSCPGRHSPSISASVFLAFFSRVVPSPESFFLFLLSYRIGRLTSSSSCSIHTVSSCLFLYNLHVDATYIVNEHKYWVVTPTYRPSSNDSS